MKRLFNLIRKKSDLKISKHYSCPETTKKNTSKNTRVNQKKTIFSEAYLQLKNK